MASPSLMLNYRATPPTIQELNGLTLSQLGGSLHREVLQTGNDDGTRHENSRVRQVWDKIFAWHGPRIYEFSGDAYYIPISGLSGGFTFLAGGAWTASGGATGTFLEDFVSGDAFAIILITSGTVTASETLTVTTGSHTATIDSNAAQGGGSGEEGEWFVTYTLSTTLKKALSHSGLFPARNGTSLILFGAFISTADNWHSLSYFPATDSWVESGILAATPGTNIDEIGSADMVGEELGFPFASNSPTAPSGTESRQARWCLINPNSGAVTQIAAVQANAGTPGRLLELGSRMVNYENRIFTAHTGFSALGDAFVLEIVGGSPSVVTGLVLSTDSNRANVNSKNGSTLFVMNGRLYWIHLGDSIHQGTTGWYLSGLKLIAGVLTNMTAQGVAFTPPNLRYETSTNDNLFSVAVLPAALAYAPAVSITVDAVWRVEKDQETNNPDGSDRVLMYHISDLNPAGVAELIIWEESQDLVVGLTWDGTTTIACDADPTTEIPVGTWIALKSDGQLFRVNTSQTGPNQLIVDNVRSLTIPTGTTDSIKILASASQGTSAGPAILSYPNTDQGDGTKFFSKGELKIDFDSVVKSPGSEKITFRVWGGGSRVVRIYAGPVLLGDPDTQVSLSSPSEGSLVADTVGHKIINVLADGLSKTVDVPLTANNFSNAENRIYSMRVSVA